MSKDYSAEIACAAEAVEMASRVSRRCRGELVTEETLLKRDRSPVTVADYAVQAVVAIRLAASFPNTPVVAEEEADALAASPALLRKVTAYVRSVVPDVDEAAVTRAIDRGGYAGGAAGRFWALDPIDGTKGFLRGEQYATALALIDEGQVVAGVLGCPNYEKGNPSATTGAAGCLVTAARGMGTTVRRLDGQAASAALVASTANATNAVFCESVESAHTSHDAAARIRELLGAHAPALRIDSQCKYAAVAVGDAAIYLRLPQCGNDASAHSYVERIWDHAAGCIAVDEAGGRVTDVRGKAFDFGLGRGLEANAGVVATNGKLHDAVLAAVAQVLR